MRFQQNRLLYSIEQSNKMILECHSKVRKKKHTNGL